MRTHQVNSLPINDVIKDIAKAFNTDYSYRCEYYIVELPANIGSGVIEGIDLGNGLGVIHYKCIFAEDTVFRFDLNEVHPLKFIFCYKGLVEHFFEEDDSKHEIKYLQNSIVASQNKKGHILKFKASLPINIFSLEISRKDYNELMNCDLNDLKQTTEDLFRDIKAEERFYYKGYYSLKIAMLINEINRFEDAGFQRKVFYHAKALQFLIEQIKLFENENLQEEQKKNFGSYEIKQIDKIAKLIQENLSTPYTIEELAQTVGLNKNKLQKGFKILFNATVNDFVKSQRILQAANLLADSSLNISEIAERVGIKSKSYFSKTFRKEFGLTPQEYQNRKRDLLNN